MKQLVFDINEMSDSKEIYGQRPNPIFAVFIYAVVGLLAAALLFCCVGKIEIVATSSGVIRPNENVSTVSNLRGGQVTQINFFDGQLVQKGDVLFTVNTAELEIQLDGLRTTREKLTQQGALVNKFIEGIQNAKNPFSADISSPEYSYYIQFENYLLQMKNTQQAFNYDMDKTEESIAVFNRQIKELQAQVAGWKSYKASVEQGKNLAGAYPAYENMYLLYAASMDVLQRDYEAQKKQIEVSSSEDKEKLLADLANAYKTTESQEYYKTIIQIDSTIATMQSEISAAQASLKQNQMAKAYYEENTAQDGTPLQISAATIEQTATLLSQKESIQAQLEEIETQILQAEEQITQGSVRAQCDGTVCVVQTLVPGDIVSSGTVVATIIPRHEDIFKVQLYVNNADIANIQVGDTVRCNVAALPSSQYGTVNGTVTKISTDTLIQDGQYSGYYLVECAISSGTLYDSDGNAGSISSGMQVEAKIVTQRKTILRYLLEKIDVF